MSIPNPECWSCIIGECSRGDLKVNGADSPMRRAVADAYLAITGKDCDFIFSGWGQELDEGQRAAYEDRLPDKDKLPLYPDEAAALLAAMQGDHFDTDAVDRALGKLTLLVERGAL